MSTEATQDRRIAVVTGAGRGIGAAIASRLAADGWAVAVHYGHSDAAAEAVVAKIRGASGEAFAFGADLDSADVGQAFWAAYDAATPWSGPIHTLVNNAGIFVPGDVTAVTGEKFDGMFRVNVSAPYHLTGAALDRLVEGGRIVMITSGAAHGASPFVTAYGMTKAALESFSRSLAAQLGPRAITVNAVSPGATETDINREMFAKNPAMKESMIAKTALGRVGQPEDIADVVAFLASDRGRWITGASLPAGGGIDL